MIPQAGLHIIYDEDPDYYYGHFDQNGNYIRYCFSDPYSDILYPWEWTLDSDIVQYARDMGVEIPVDPQIDFSKTF